nr:hypothetical protein [Tanacetum cinerariifolium]
MVDDNVGNQFRQNAVQNVGHLVGQNAVQNQGAYDEIEEVNVNCTLKDNLQQASTSGTQTESALVNDSYRSTEGNSRSTSCIVEETRAYFESLYNNFATEVKKVNTVNRKLRKTNADLTIELARYKNQEKCFEISQEKYDNLKGVIKSLFIKSNVLL